MMQKAASSRWLYYNNKQLGGLLKPKLFDCVLSERVRLKQSIGRICFYTTARYFQGIQLH